VKHLNALAIVVLGIAGPALAATPQAAPSADGHAVFQKWCAPCHDAGPYHGGTAGLAVKYRGTNENPVLEQRTDLTPEFVKATVRTGVNAMPPFRRTEVSNAELDALAKFLSQKNPSIK
jgi:mono/diheme cytochrome c family protein